MIIGELEFQESSIGQSPPRGGEGVSDSYNNTAIKSFVLNGRVLGLGILGILSQSSGQFTANVNVTSSVQTGPGLAITNSVISSSATTQS